MKDKPTTYINKLKGLYQTGTQSCVPSCVKEESSVWQGSRWMISWYAVGLPNHINIYLHMLQTLCMFHIIFLDKCSKSSVCLFRYTILIAHCKSTNYIVYRLEGFLVHFSFTLPMRYTGRWWNVFREFLLQKPLWSTLTWVRIHWTSPVFLSVCLYCLHAQRKE